MFFNWICAKVNIYRLFTFQLTKFKNSKFLTSQHSICKIMNSKPPNILVYTGTNCPDLFKKVEKSILKCLQVDSYVVYHLLASEIGKNPWMENSVLLVISSDIVENDIAAAFETYLKNFGNILLICSKTDCNFLGTMCLQLANNDNLIQIDFKSLGKVFMLRGKYSYGMNGIVLCQDSANKALIQKTIHNNNILITSEIYLDRDPDDDHSNKYICDNRLSLLKYILTEEFGLESNTDNTIPELSSFGYFLCYNELEEARILKGHNLDNISSVKSTFHECKFRIWDEIINIPVYFCDKNLSKTINFDKDIYFSNLHADVYGRNLVYFPVITSTMEAAEQLSMYEGIVIAAHYQINGRGRGNNKWISPEGCAMFTLLFTVPLSSNLGSKITLLQHIASLAVVEGIKSKEIYKDLELKIKWPNDIYYKKMKLGGLIVSTIVQKDLACVNIGWGINVANKRPTSCLNFVIDEYNSENKCALPYLSIEEIIACTVSQMEYFVKDFIKFGPKNFLSKYYLTWMHGNQTVTLMNLNEQGTITGIDEFGFLQVKLDNGEIVTFQPDGNRFDIMKNLIHTK